jgi:methyl-accepting chemotaxis protein
MQLLDVACGVGLLEGVLIDGDSAHPQKHLVVRRIAPPARYESEKDLPNVVESWADKLHPEDRQKTFDAFAASLEDRTGTYR